MGVIDGVKTRGIENDAEIQTRKDFLPKIGYES
jgi:adenosine/AMP kinase